VFKTMSYPWMGLINMSHRESRRRFIAVPEDIIYEAMEASERIGIPYNVLIEKALRMILDVVKYKPSIVESLAMVDSVDDLRRLGGVFLPWPTARRVIEGLDNNGFHGMLGELSKMCRWFGELSRVKRGSSPREFQSTLSLWMPVATVDVVPEEGGVYRFIISVVDSSPRIIEVAKTIATSLAEGYGLKIIDVSQGSNTVAVRVTGFLEKE